jgi:hypothetical protein
LHRHHKDLRLSRVFDQGKGLLETPNGLGYVALVVTAALLPHPPPQLDVAQELLEALVLQYLQPINEIE